MDKSARLQETSLPPEYGQGSKILNSPDITLPERLRSLLLSRNKKRPPTTPCPTPDYRYHSLQPLHTAIGNALAPPRTHSFNATKAIASLRALESLQETMGATRFDGPAGQVMERSVSQNRRNSGEVRMPSDRVSLVEERRNSNVSGIDQKSQGDLMGTRLSAMGALNHPVSTGPTRPTYKIKPRISYTLRTVPPKKYERVSQQIPSDDQSPPGYRSETGLEITPFSVEDHSNETHVHHGSSTSAVDALHHIQDHHSQPVPNETYDSPHLIENDGPSSNPETSERPAGKPTTSDEIAQPKEPPPAQPPEKLIKLPLIPLRNSSLLSLHSVPLGAEEDIHAPDTPLLSRTPSEKEHGLDKRSRVSRALSVMSNMSSTSGLRITHRQSVPHDDGIPEVNNNDHHSIGPSTSPANGRANPRQKRVDEEQSRASLGPSNLTARPSQQKKVPVDASHAHVGNTESTDEASIIQKQQQAKESFQKVIGDLESLLTEALHIAGGTSRQRSEMDGEVPQTQGNGYRRLSCAESDDRSTTSTGSIDEEVPRGHVVIMEPDEEDLYHAHFKKVRDATPFPRSLAMTRQASTEPSVLGEESRKSGQEMSVHEADLEPTTKSAHPDKVYASVDWALVKRPPPEPMKEPTVPPSLQVPANEQQRYLIRDHSQTPKASGHTNASHRRLPVQPRGSSLALRQRPSEKAPQKSTSHMKSSEESVSTSGPYVADFRNTAISYHPVYRGIDTVAKRDERAGEAGVAAPSVENKAALPSQPEPPNQEQGHSHPTREEIRKGYSLKGLHHFEIREPHGFSLSRSHRRAPIARDWGAFRKRFVATVTCINTALLGLIIGIYAGEVPAIQYALADDRHIVILGNVVFFIGLAITTALFWPLPLLHGRRPYTTAALIIVLLLLLPQALAVNGSRSPYIATYRVGLLVPRAFAGLVMGFANINFKTTLLDLFGSSLQSGNPHQEVINENDVRRHGGGMGVWLGIWTWCSLGSIGIGFWIGASIISGLQVSWGFWILIILTAAVLFLNVLTPETRRSAYRRSMAEVRDGTDISRRIARGEIKMHLNSTGPVWWWEEVWAGHVLCIRMLKQPGFTILALYLAWIYGQVVLVIVVGNACT